MSETKSFWMPAEHIEDIRELAKANDTSCSKVLCHVLGKHMWKYFDNSGNPRKTILFEESLGNISVSH